MTARRVGLPAGADAALAPIRAAIAAEGARLAAEERARVQQRASEVRERARADGERIIAAAAADGRATGTIAARDRSARTRRAAMEEVLAHREAARRGLAAAVRAEARALTADPAYPEILRTLEDRGRRVLGPDAAVTEHPDGGVAVTAGSRELDLSLPALADAVLQASQGEVAGVWSA